MLISFLIAFPLIASALIALSIRVVDKDIVKYLAFIGSLIPLIGSIYAWMTVDFEGNVLLGDIALTEEIAWIDVGGYEIQYLVGLDGVSIVLILLTALLSSLAIMSAWKIIDKRENQFYALTLFLEGSLIGVFASLDFLLFYVFWEAVLIPMYFLIAVWGHERRRYAAMKFFVYTNIASLIMFIGVVALFFNSGIDSFSLVSLTQAVDSGSISGAFGVSQEIFMFAVFIALFIGFAVKVPIVPFHTWLPDAHVEAPSPVSVLLAGVLLKMGTYAILRFNFTMLSDIAIQLTTPIAVIGALSVIYGAILAASQNDLKRIVAYSSISSMGYVLVGLAAFTYYGIGGATFQMISHGLLSGLLFMVVGVVYSKTHTRQIDELSGLAQRMPWVAGAFVAGAFGYLGLPGMSGFAAELFVFLGSFNAFPMSLLIVPIAMFGIVIVAGYLLFSMQLTFFGEYKAPDIVEEASPGEILPLVVLILAVVFLGIYPDIAYNTIQTSTSPIVDFIAGGL